MGVLDGVKVVELAEHGFVPSCGAILADWGADVVKVERPTGDPLRAIMGMGFVADTGDFNFLFELYNRNKRGITLDLRIDEGRSTFDRLIEDADVFLTSFLPSARDRLHITPEDLWKVNPSLVYAKGHGQGQRGPDADLGGFDAISFWSRGGIGHILTAPDAPLVMPRGAFGDAPSGAMLAGGVAAALFKRERERAEGRRRSASDETPHAASPHEGDEGDEGGKGVIVDVALLATAVWQLSTDLTATAVLREEPKKLSAGTSLANPMVGPFRTSDDRWLMLNMLDDVRHWPPLCHALGIDELVDDARFADSDSRRANAEALHAIFVELFGARPLPDLVAALAAEDTLFSTMASPLEVIDDPQVVANGYLAQHPTEARARLATSPMQFDDEMTEIRRGAPGLGEHTAEVLAEAGLSAAEVDALREAGAIA
jgi:crotonobetainyl-CoA:carnitine CoA-transferase CaiB-like acyl-CoA transferase